MRKTNEGKKKKIEEILPVTIDEVVYDDGYALLKAHMDTNYFPYRFFFLPFCP